MAKFILRGWAACLALLLAAGAQMASVRGQTGAGTFFPTGSMNYGRISHTATLLTNGQVLVVGGVGNVGSTGIIDSVLASAEIYNPVTGAWMLVAPMFFPRVDHTATLLTNGEVLLAGGAGNYSTQLNLSNCEIYDPATGTWAFTSPMLAGRAGHTATMLTNGTVLVAGGDGTNYLSQFNTLSTAEIYDPAIRLWTQTGPMTTNRVYHTAALLPGGQVLVAGGFGLNGLPLYSSELYDPTTGTWTLTGNMISPRIGQTETVLPDGRVLVAGGSACCGPIQMADIYTPGSGTWSPAPAMLADRDLHTATLLPDGQVLVVGGQDDFGDGYFSAEIYDPVAASWSYARSLTTGRFSHTATMLQGGHLLIAGGASSSPGPFGGDFQRIAAAELYNPSAGSLYGLTITLNSSVPLLQLEGWPGTNYILQYNSSLLDSNWSALSQFTLTTNPCDFLDVSASNAPIRFYRAITQ